MFEKLVEISREFLKNKNSPYKRYLIRTTDFSHRVSVVVGQRGVGKTTMIVQYLLDKVKGDRFDDRILYVQADHFLMGDTSLYEIADKFQLSGGKWLAIDEVHKYSNWAQELKSIYDTFPVLTLIVSGSSALEIYKGTHDLVRRSVCYYMAGMSFREYLELSLGVELKSWKIEELCKNNERIAASIIEVIEGHAKKILPLFHSYLKVGYYPYFFELRNEDIFKMTLEQNLHMTIEADLAAIYPHLTGVTIKKIKQLLIFIANTVPFIPNWEKIKSALEIGDVRTLKMYFEHLEDAGLIKSITKASKKFSRIESPDKVFLNNSNQLFAISLKPEIGTVRETFFLSMLSQNHTVTLPLDGDFLVNDEYLFEVGGRNKTFKQIKESKKGYLACDDIELGMGTKIPLWLFGFLY
ncbi:MAG: AAA family ATPase [Chlamydiae bacterium]|nr:AAA family ATPase [Chlamydiota bacterium]